MGLATAQAAQAAEAFKCQNRAFSLFSGDGSNGGPFVSAELGAAQPLYGMLRARARLIGEWELYRMECQKDGSFAIIGPNQRYVTAEYGYSPSSPYYGMLRARNKIIDSWQRFKFKPQGPQGGLWVTGALQSLRGEGLYVAAEFGTNPNEYPGNLNGLLRARTRASAIGAWETFTIWWENS